MAFSTALAFLASEKAAVPLTTSPGNFRSITVMAMSSAGLLPVPSFGKGSSPADDIAITVMDLKLPGGTNEVRLGDEVKNFSFRIENFSDSSLGFNVEVLTSD